VFKLTINKQINYLTMRQSKMSLLALCLFMAVNSWAQTSTPPSVGDGSSAHPYQIVSLDNLYWLSQTSSAWDKSFIQTANINASSSSSWDAGSGFTPIGTEAIKFTGTYNGKGHTINGLFINRPALDYAGLFGYVLATEIDSLGLTNINIAAEAAVGGLAGFSDNSSVNYCYSTGNTSGTTYVGGLIGHNYNNSSVTHCYTTGKVSGSSFHIGGLIGYNNEYSAISYSYSACNVFCPTNAAGGLTSWNQNYSTISYCYSTGFVTGINYVGSLVGSNLDNSTINNCWASGKVKCAGTAGGLVGRNEGTSATNNCYWDMQSSGMSLGYGSNDVTSSFTNNTGLTTSQLKQSTNLTNLGSFTTIWQIRELNTYPALRGVDNAPFTYSDSLHVSKKSQVRALLINDYDYETLQTALTVKIDSLEEGTVANGIITLPGTAVYKDVILVYYHAGEIRASKGDTLWGYSVKSKLIYNTPPVFTAVSSKTTNEDVAITLSMSDVTASDADNDALSLIIGSGSNYTVSSSTVTPTANYNGSLTVPISITDGADTSVVRNMTITLTAVNDAPVLTAVSSKTTNEDVAITLAMSDVTASDVDGNTLSLVVGTGSNYTVTGTTVTPAANYHGSLTVPVHVTDGTLSSGTMNMTITVTSVNDAPVLTAVSSKTTNEDVALALAMSDVTASDVDGDALTLVVGTGSNYTVSGTTITPAANYHGSLTVPLHVTDGTLSSGTLNMTITVTSVNDAPVLSAVSNKTTDEDVALTLSLSDVTASDVDGDALTLVVGTGSNYTVSGTTITPAANYHGTLTVPLHVTDGTLSSGTLNMTVTVTSVNDAPVLSAVSNKTTDEDVALTLSLSDVTASDVDGDALTLVVGTGSNYTVSATTVTPDADYHGTLTVPVSVTDGVSSSATMNMTVTVTAVNDAPVLTAVSSPSTSEDVALTLSLSDVTASDIDGDALTLVVGAGNNYTVSGTTITPAANYNGALTVPVSVTDGTLSSASMDMTITVTAVNNPPVLTAVSSPTTNEDVALTLSLSDVTASDIDGDNLTLVVGAGDNYTVEASTITPVANYNGTLSVPVYVTDGSASSAILNMTVTVTAVNDAPVLSHVKDSTIIEGNSITLSLSDVTASDVEGDALSLVVMAGTNYTVSGNTITPATGFTGSLAIDIAVSDGSLSSNIIAMNVTVNAPPVGVPEIDAAKIRLYPNPAGDEVFIQGAKGLVYIYDLNGRMALTQKIADDGSVAVSTLTSGMYIIKIYGKEFKLMKK
jgi:hypothetical protein